MIAEAHEIRENQSYRNVTLTNLGIKQNVNEKPVSSLNSLFSNLVFSVHSG